MQRWEFISSEYGIDPVDTSHGDSDFRLERVGVDCVEGVSPDLVRGGGEGLAAAKALQRSRAWRTPSKRSCALRSSATRSSSVGTRSFLWQVSRQQFEDEAFGCAAVLRYEKFHRRLAVLLVAGF